MLSIYKNSANIGELKKVYQEKGDSLAAMIGAGASKLLIKDWRNMLLDMAKEFGSSINIDEELEKKTHPQIAQEIFDFKPDIKKYKSFMKNSMSATNKYISLHNKIIQNFKIILTTNFDNTFKECANDYLRLYAETGNNQAQTFQISCLPNLFITHIRKHPHWLVYLHGNVENEHYIFRESEYKHNYPKFFKTGLTTSSLEEFLKSIFTQLNIVFIGFSFNDTYFIKNYEYCLSDEISRMKSEKKYHKTNFPNHFVFLHEDECINYLTQNDKISFNDDKNWNDLFVKNGKGYLPCPSISSKIKNIKIDKNKFDELIQILNKLKQNKQRISLFSKINGLKNNILRVIKLKSYDDIEDILDYLDVEKTERVQKEGFVWMN